MGKECVYWLRLRAHLSHIKAMKLLAFSHKQVHNVLHRPSIVARVGDTNSFLFLLHGGGPPYVRIVSIPVRKLTRSLR
jgi:hypothetical protein